MYQKLFDLIARHHALSEADETYFKQVFQPMEVPKNTVLERAGKVPKHLYFINKGYLRLYHLSRLGEEVTTHLNCPPGFFTSYQAFNSLLPSTENVATITACELLAITKTDLDLLVQNNEAFKTFSTWVFQQALNYNEERTREMVTLTATERYKKLLQTFPDLAQHIPVQYIASYLGVKPESLSRIRRKIIS